MDAKNVENAASLEDCWEIMRQFPPDLMITPMYFEHSTAVELLIKTRADDLLKEVSFVLIPSADRLETCGLTKQAGVIAILPKPLAANDLKMAPEGGNRICRCHNA